MKRGKIKNWPPDHQGPAHRHQDHDQHFQDRHQVSNTLTTSMSIKARRKIEGQTLGVENEIRLEAKWRVFLIFDHH